MMTSTNDCPLSHTVAISDNFRTNILLQFTEIEFLGLIIIKILLNSNNILTMILPVSRLNHEFLGKT